MNESIFDKPTKGSSLLPELGEALGGEIHTRGLYDEGQDSGGETIDLATGKSYAEQDTVGAIDGLNVVEDPEKVPAHMVGIDDDDAAQWLREHGG